jgi:ribosomal protein S18 acetylase RimI-like enzyme
MLDECAEFWWNIYEHMPYVKHPDGGETINTPTIGPEHFAKHLKAGFNRAWYWIGDVTDDSVILVEDEGKIAGILVCSVDHEKLTGNILSCCVQRDNQGREIADMLLSEAIERFRKMGLYRVVAGPNVSKTMEVECPIHLAVLDAGLAWDSWDPAWRDPEYEVFLGGSLEGFRLQPEINQKIEQLRKEGITIERCMHNQLPLRRLDTGEEVEDPIGDDGICAFVAFVNGLAVGWTFEVLIFEDEGRICSMVGPEVIPSYRRKGIGKVLHHLGTEEVVRQGAQYGWTATNIHNPARLIYRSVGFRYWYTSFSRMSKRLR